MHLLFISHVYVVCFVVWGLGGLGPSEPSLVSQGFPRGYRAKLRIARMPCEPTRRDGARSGSYEYMVDQLHCVY